MLGKCKFEGCSKNASFGYIETRSREFCVTHKKENCINVVNPLCLFDGCKIQATYGTVDFKKKYCSKHKTDQDKHISKHKT